MVFVNKIKTLAKNNTTTLIDLGLILFLGLLSLTWFKGNNFIGGGDFAPPLDWVRQLKMCFTSWDETFSFGLYRPVSVWIPISMFGAFFQVLSSSALFSEKVMIFSWFAGSGISMYFLCSVLKMRRMGKLISSFFYMLCPFSLMIIWHVSHGMIQMPYAFAPMVLALYIKGIEEKHQLKYLLLSSFLISLLTGSSYANVRSVFMHGVPIFFYFVSIMLFDKEKRNFTLKFSGLFLITLVLMNFYWIFPFMSGLKENLDPHLSVLMSDVDSLKQSSVSLDKSIRMLGYWSMFGGYKGEPYYTYWNYYLLPNINILSWFIPIFVILGLLYKQVRSKKLLFFYLSVIIFGLLGIEGPLPPFGALFSWIYQHIPYSTLAARFTFLCYGQPTYLIFSVLFGLGFLFTIDHGKKWLKSLIYFPVFILLILICVVLVFPFWTGEVIRPQGKIYAGERFKVPSYWYDAGKWLKTQEDYFRIFPLPMSRTYNSFIFWGEGYAGSGLTWWLTEKPLIWINTGQSFQISETIGNMIEEGANFKKVEKLLGLMNVKYLLVQDDTRWDFAESHTWQFAHDPQNIEEFISKQENLSLVKQFDKLKFYSVKPETILPRIYSANTINWVQGEAKVITDLTNFINFSNKETVVFSDQNQKMLPNSLAMNNFFLWQKPDLVDDNNLKQANYKISISKPGSYEIFLRDDNLQNYYNFSLKTIELSVDGKEKITASLEKYPDNLFKLGKIEFGEGEHKITVLLPEPINLTENNSFENGLWEKIELMASQGGTRDAVFALSNDTVLGKYSADLVSSQNSAAIFSPIKSFLMHGTYQVNFYVKHLEGLAPLVATWQNFDKSLNLHWEGMNSSWGTSGHSTNLNFSQLPSANNWQKIQFSFTPGSAIKMAGLIFFSPGNGGVNTQKNQNLLDEVSVYKKFDNPIFLKLSVDDKQIDNPKITWKKKSQVEYEITVEDAKNPFYLVFSEAFHKKWLISLPQTNHFMINGFANGWYVEKPGNYKIKLTFAPQKDLVMALTVSVITMLFSLLIIVFSKSKTNNKK